MGRLYTAFQFLDHFRQARRWDSFHSPYLFDLFTCCCDDKKGSPVFEKAEKHRKSLLSSTEEIARIDYGAGSVTQPNKELVRVSQIAQNALSHPFQCRFLFRLVKFLKPHRMLEFGTSFGLSTAYLSAGCPTSNINTVEGDNEVARIARNTFFVLRCKNISIFNTTFQDYIDEYLNQQGEIDLLFLDGHHTSEALLNYYHLLKHKLHSNSIVVVDDIYWSRDMNFGWKELIHLPEVTQSVDCFHFGLLFFKADFIGQENHKIRLPINMLLANR